MVPKESSGQGGRRVASHFRRGAGREGDEEPHAHLAYSATASSSQKHRFGLAGMRQASLVHGGPSSFQTSPLLLDMFSGKLQPEKKQNTYPSQTSQKISKPSQFDLEYYFSNHRACLTQFSPQQINQLCNNVTLSTERERISPVKANLLKADRGYYYLTHCALERRSVHI